MPWEPAGWSTGEPQPTSVPLQIDDPRWIGYTFELVYNRQELSQVKVIRDDQAAPFKAELFQRIPLGALDRAARERVGKFLANWDKVSPGRAAHLFPDPLDWLHDVADGDTNSESDVRMARLSKRYVELNGQPGWRETLAEEFHYSLSSVQTVIGRARKRRLLTPVAQGQVGGQLTPKAWQLLAPQDQQSAWARATPQKRVETVAREELHLRIRTELRNARHSGETDSATHMARSLALASLVIGAEPEASNPDYPAGELREAVRYLKATYEELS